MATSRSVNGLLLLDKPIGLSSNAALQKVKRLFAARKAGHTGSLDPLATGMLPICFGAATKFSQFLLQADKRYIVEAKLGEVTTTSDAEGEIVASKPVPVLTSASIEAVLQPFRGESMQVPSMFSALKHQGQPLYKLARQGIEVKREARPIHIYDLQLLNHSDNYLQLNVACSKGTYIRTLIADIGDMLGCGAHVTALRRLQVGQFSSSQMLTLEQLLALQQTDDFQALDRQLMTIATAMQAWPEVAITDSAWYRLCQGRAVSAVDSSKTGLVRLMRKDVGFVGIGEILADGRMAPKKIISEID